MFSYAVENNHRLVHRVTQDGKHRRQYRQRELPVHDGEDAHHDHNIVKVGDDGCYRELPLKAEGQVDHDAYHHQGKRRTAVTGELIAHLRADKLRTL